MTDQNILPKQLDDTPTIAVIILTLNQLEKTVRCLESFALINPRPAVKMLLWDNGSKDKTSSVIQERYPNVAVYYSPDNLGVAGGRNKASAQAIELFSPDFLFFIDNDMTIEPDTLSYLLAPFSEPKMAQTTGKILDMFEPDRIYGAGGCQVRFWLGDTNHIGFGEKDLGQYDRAKSCLPSGGCMLIRADIFKQFDGFDETFNPYGPEDLDLGMRIKRAGYESWYVPEAVVYHEPHPGRTFGGGGYSQAYADNRAKQWFRFMKRHAPLYGKIGFYCLGAPYLLINIIKREISRNNLGPALKGLWNGFRNEILSS